MALFGIDTSNNNAGVPDKSMPVDFIIFKATEGVGYTDPDCNPSYQEAKAAGKLVGVYHFARPDGNDPISEANWFVSQIQGYIGEAVLILDLEVNPITPLWAKQWLDRVYELTHVRPMIYMSASKFNSTGDWSQVWPNYGAWVAGYPSSNPIYGNQNMDFPYNIDGGWNVAMWQYSSNGHFPQYSGRLDMDVFYGDANAWRAYARIEQPNPAPEPTPTPVETPPVTTPDTTSEPVVTKPVVNTPVAKTSAWSNIVTAIINFIKRLFRIK